MKPKGRGERSPKKARNAAKKVDLFDVPPTPYRRKAKADGKYNPDATLDPSQVHVDRSYPKPSAKPSGERAKPRQTKKKK